MLGRGQAVRRGTLDPVFEGSNPSAPTNLRAPWLSGELRLAGPAQADLQVGQCRSVDVVGGVRVGVTREALGFVLDKKRETTSQQ